MNLIDLVIALAQEYPIASAARVLSPNYNEALAGSRTNRTSFVSFVIHGKKSRFRPYYVVGVLFCRIV